MKASEVLKSAAELIRTNGHCKGKLQNNIGCLCTAGAINYAATGSPYKTSRDADDAYDALSEFIGTSYIPHWNDEEERTAEDVILALESAAEKCE